MRSLFRLSPPAVQAPSRLQRDSIAFVLSDGRRIDVLRVRDPRARRLRLSVGERGARLTLPPRASLVAGERFLHEHRDWLTAQMAPHEDDAQPLVPGQPGSVPLRGVRLPLRWETGRAARVLHQDDAVVVQLPPRAGAAAATGALRDFYEAQARADIGRWLPAYLPGLPRPPRRIRLRVLSSQWGSLAPDGSLTLDLALVLGRPQAFHYVLVHELCHLLHADHSRAFWREVELRCPAWRLERDYFRDEGRRLKAALHVLLG
ncbi:MAG TPA: SprT family zinc-dependent metalloprotease [Luteimonas sp.]|nr:SprT family zinc-dependent metalloprotease [Luteimonas sp.]